jgi:hypothetical protein
MLQTELFNMTIGKTKPTPDRIRALSDPMIEAEAMRATI